jgi:glutaredoxin 3
MTNIIIYSKDTCPYCVRAKSLLKSKGQSYTEKNIQNDPANLKEMQEKTNNARTVPQIIINGTLVGGCDDLYALNDQGKLDALLKG